MQNLGIGEEQIIDYCYENPDIDADDEDDEITIKNALDYTTEVVADKLLELFSADDLFDYFFSATYDFEQEILSHREDFKILEPISLRKRMKEIVKSMCEMYDDLV